MTDAQAKRVGMTEARKWFLRREAPQTEQAISMMLPESSEESPSWLDVMDYDSMLLDENGILHVEATVRPVKTVEHINFSVLLQ